MKKLLSISFAFMILLSGMHLTIATHYCGGKIAASKVSLSGELATCGMEESADQCPVSGKQINNHCCVNKVLALAVENNYAPSFSEFKVIPQHILQVFAVPVSYTFHSPASNPLICTNVDPPGYFQASAVSLPDICVFRI